MFAIDTRQHRKRHFLFCHNVVDDILSAMMGKFGKNQLEFGWSGPSFSLVVSALYSLELQ